MSGTTTGTDIMQKLFTLVVSGARTGHQKAVEMQLKCTTWNSFRTWKTDTFFTVPVQAPAPIQLQCEMFYLKPYNQFVHVLVSVWVPETASVNTPGSITALLTKCNIKQRINKEIWFLRVSTGTGTVSLVTRKYNYGTSRYIM